jgi:hypothetical protein
LSDFANEPQFGILCCTHGLFDAMRAGFRPKVVVDSKTGRDPGSRSGRKKKRHFMPEHGEDRSA